MAIDSGSRSPTRAPGSRPMSSTRSSSAFTASIAAARATAAAPASGWRSRVRSCEAHGGRIRAESAAGRAPPSRSSCPATPADAQPSGAGRLRGHLERLEPVLTPRLLVRPANRPLGPAAVAKGAHDQQVDDRRDRASTITRSHSVDPSTPAPSAWTTASTQTITVGPVQACASGERRSGGAGRSSARAARRGSRR